MTLMGKIFRPWDLAVEDSKSQGSHCHTQSAQSSGSDLISPPSNFTINHHLDLCDTKDSCNISGDAGVRSEVVAKRDNLHAKADRRKMCSKSDKNNDKHKKESQSYSSSESWANCEPEMSHCIPSMDPDQAPLYLPHSAINNLANLSRSELTAMGLLPPDPPTMKVKRQRPKRFHCPHCQVAFSNNGQLRGHVRIHTGERPFSCEYEGCGKSFTRNEELTRHRRIHSGLRPFPCAYCGKKFGRKDHLKKHTRTHQRPMFSTATGMIGFGNPFHPFHPPLVPNDFGPVQPSYGLPFVLNMPTPSVHFPFSS